MKLKIVALLAALSLAGAARGAVVTSTFNNVTLLGNLYNVTFYQDTTGSTPFNAVFPVGGPSLPFTAANAFTATSQLLAAVNAANFDVTPGNSDPTVEGFRLVFGYTATDYDYYTGWRNTAGNGFTGVFGPFNFPRNIDNTLSIVTFRAANPVPAPATLLLVGLGLATLAATRRRG